MSTANRPGQTAGSPSAQGPSFWKMGKPARWALGLGIVFMTGVALVLLFLLTLATNNRSFYEENFTRLVVVNVAVAVVLLLVIVWLSVRLALRLKRRKFGSQLLLKLVAIFALVGLLPGLLIYTVSYQFVSRSIETWFDVRVETALTAGLNLGRTTLDTLSADLAGQTRAAANGLSGSSNAGAGLAMERLREQLLASDLVLWSANGQALASAGDSRFELNPERPSGALLRQVRERRVVASIEGLEDLDLQGVVGPEQLQGIASNAAPRIKVLALVPPTTFGLGAQERFLQVTAPLPVLLVADALAVQIANREYQERALGREGLRRMYIGTLTLALFLSVFGAVLLAALLGNQLVRPLLVLAEGMRDVARGDLTPKVSLAAKDELAGLTRTFAHMTAELSDARQAVQQSMRQVDTARANLQTILDNLTAGVVVLDAKNRILSVNPGATRILRAPLAAHLGEGFDAMDGLGAFSAWVVEQFERFLSDPQHDGGHWQQSFELRPDAGAAATAGPSSDGNGVVTLIARGALLPNGDRLLVFDDVSEIISAQRAQAWGEVARRLAHEIKNPLTPIQLSAERLAMKLEGKLQGPESAVLNKSVKTIVDQVDAMKRLVNEFRDYARLPAAQLLPVDLNALVSDITQLYENSDVPVRLELSADCPQVLADPQQVRQVVHNLVQNAQDATPVGAGTVVLQTRPSESGRWVRLHVLDAGPGFTESIMKRAFEPYVTTKPKGTGLGLAVVKKIMDEHGGRIELAHRLDDDGHTVRGAQVSLSFKVAN
jgi:nitrogen fixation/metabolism regulation signal transduction histidine kinase